jgi:hypothetical protein
MKPTELKWRKFTKASAKTGLWLKKVNHPDDKDLNMKFVRFLKNSYNFIYDFAGREERVRDILLHSPLLIEDTRCRHKWEYYIEGKSYLYKKCSGKCKREYVEYLPHLTQKQIKAVFDVKEK